MEIGRLRMSSSGFYKIVMYYRHIMKLRRYVKIIISVFKLQRWARKKIQRIRTVKKAVLYL